MGFNLGSISTLIDVGSYINDVGIKNIPSDLISKANEAKERVYAIVQGDIQKALGLDELFDMSDITSQLETSIDTSSLTSELTSQGINMSDINFDIPDISIDSSMFEIDTSSITDSLSGQLSNLNIGL